MIRFLGQHIPYNRELFVFLSREKVSVSHGHGDILVAHELLQLHERDLAGLRQPRREGVPHGVQGDGIHDRPPLHDTKDKLVIPVRFEG